jgi:hypothetical protein
LKMIFMCFLLIFGSIYGRAILIKFQCNLGPMVGLYIE